MNSARLYANASRSSLVITQISYGEQVTLLETTTLWNKVIYTNFDGEEVEGWITKRNLMTYCDYQFNSDDLYSLD